MSTANPAMANNNTAIDGFKNFPTLSKRKSPNDYLVCPKDTCKEYDEISPLFPVSVENLKIAWDKMLKQQPRVQLVKQDLNRKQAIWVQRSAVFRFPDYITVEFVPISNNRSSLIIYSTSKYGHYDFGVNQKRVKSWLTALEQQIKLSQH